MPSSATRAVLIPFLLVTLIWGSTWIIIRDQLGPVPATWSVSYRFFIAGAAMFAWAKYDGASLRLSRRDAVFVVGVGTLQFVINFNFVYAAESYITSGLVSVVFALLIVPNTVFGRVFLGQTITRRFLVGSGIAIAGVLLLFVHELRVDGNGTRAVLLGIGLTMVAVMGASAANVLQATDRAGRIPVAVLLAWAMLTGAVLNAALAWTSSGPPVFEARLGYVAGLFYLGLVASAFAFTLYYRIIRAIGPARSAYSSVLVPIIAMSLSTVFEGYRWTALAAIGGVFVLAGLVVALRSRAVG